MFCVLLNVFVVVVVPVGVAVCCEIMPKYMHPSLFLSLKKKKRPPPDYGWLKIGHSRSKKCMHTYFAKQKKENRIDKALSMRVRVCPLQLPAAGHWFGFSGCYHRCEYAGACPFTISLSLARAVHSSIQGSIFLSMHHSVRKSNCRFF